MSRIKPSSETSNLKKKKTTINKSRRASESARNSNFAKRTKTPANHHQFTRDDSTNFFSRRNSCGRKNENKNEKKKQQNAEISSKTKRPAQP